MLLDDLESEPQATVACWEIIHQRHRATRNYTRTLAEAVVSRSAALERAGAWLLRRQVADAGNLPEADLMVVLDGLSGVRSWAGRLILCQMLSERPGLMDAAPSDVAAFLRDCAGDPKPTVRAWSVNALQMLAAAHAEFRPEARRLLRAARLDPAKCVQARLRHIK